MANIINLTGGLTWNGNPSVIQGTVSAVITQSGNGALGNIQTFTTTTSQVSYGSVTTIGYLFIKNLDATNYVEFDLNTPVAGTAFCKLLPGEAMVVPTRQTTVYGKSNTANVDCLVVAIEL